MEQALEPTYEAQPETKVWCAKCGYPISDEDRDAEMCRNCLEGRDGFLESRKNWTYLPLLILLKYHKWGLPGSILALGFFFYGVLEFLQWLFL